MKWTSLVFILFFAIRLFSQEGHLHITNYPVNEKFAHQKINDIAFNSSNVAFYASKYGVSTFDGHEWRKIQNVPSNVFAINKDTATNILYLGLKNEIGYIKKQDNGKYKYTRIHAFKKEIGNFTQIAITDRLVVFYNEKSINLIEKSNPTKIIQFNSKDFGNFAGIFQFRNEVFVNVKHKGLYKIYNLNLKKLNKGIRFKEENIRFSAKYNSKKILLGTSKNKIYLFDGNTFVQFADFTEIRDFLNENILNDGINFSSKYFVVTTLNGGCALIDKIYGKIVRIVDHQSGLPDDEIFAVAKDKNNGLWLAHEQGLSRCNIDMPVRKYSSYAGLNGAIQDVKRIKKTIYVATNNGVYRLQKGSTNRYQYRKIKRLNEKSKQVFSFDGTIFTSTNYGLFLINDSVAEKLIDNAYINDVCFDKKTGNYLVATLNGMIKLTKENDVWKQSTFIPNFNAPVYSLVIDKKGKLFIGAHEKAYIAGRNDDGEWQKIKKIAHTERIYEPVNFVMINDSVYDIQSEGVFKYDEESASLLYTRIDHIKKQNIPYILSENNAWIYERNNWRSVDHTKKYNNLVYLKLFPGIKNIFANGSSTIWITSKSDEIFKIDAGLKDQSSKALFLSVDFIADQKDSLYALSNAQIPYYNNALRFSFIAPFYLNTDDIKFRYTIEGLKNYKNWSQWTQNSIVELSAIPPGNYTLKVVAKNVFGEMSNVENVSFTILTPFWQEKWFVYTTIFAGMLIVLLIFYAINRRIIRKNIRLEKEVKKRTVALRKEKAKSDALLLNILPKETATELKNDKKVEPQNYDKVTILFTDFKGFTKIAEKMSPKKLVEEIDYCFREFDKIISKYKIEKIKTIGDAYMCAGGLPTKNPKHAFEVVKAGLEIRDFMEKYKNERKKEGKAFFEIRIGINTGKVVAGVVGTKKYAYDIWGDAVNLASRMESSGEVGRVNISQNTYKIVKHDFSCTHRGKIEAKNKGEVDMYFVERKK